MPDPLAVGVRDAFQLKLTTATGALGWFARSHFGLIDPGAQAVRPAEPQPHQPATLRRTEDVVSLRSIKRPHYISAIAFSTTESRLAVAEKSGEITFWDPATGDSIDGSLDCGLPIT